MTNREWDEMLRQRAQKEVFQVSPKMEHVLKNTLLNPEMQKKTRRILTRGTALALAGVMGCIGAAYALSNLTAHPDVTVAPQSAQSDAGSDILTATLIPYQTAQPTPTPVPAQTAQPMPTQAADAWYSASQEADPQLLKVAAALTEMLDEIASSDDYVSLMGGGGNIQETIRAWGTHRHAVPRAVYQAELSTTPENDALQPLRDHASDALWKQATSRINSALASQINAAKGAETLAASAICTVQTAFTTAGDMEQIHYILLYDDAAPVMVSFTPYPQESGAAVTASATFLALDNATDPPQYLAALDTGYGAVQCSLVWQR